MLGADIPFRYKPKTSYRRRRRILPDLTFGEWCVVWGKFGIACWGSYLIGSTLGAKVGWGVLLIAVFV